MYGQPVKHKCLYFGVLCFAIPLNFAPSPLALAQEQEKPAIAPLPRTVNLTQEQRSVRGSLWRGAVRRPRPSTRAPREIFCCN